MDLDHADNRVRGEASSSSLGWERELEESRLVRNDLDEEKEKDSRRVQFDEYARYWLLILKLWTV